MWFSGIGIPNALQGAVIVSRIFPSIEAWGQGYDMYFAGNFSEENALLAKAASCGPVRTHIGTRFYVAAWWTAAVAYALLQSTNRTV